MSYQYVKLGREITSVVILKLVENTMGCNSANGVSFSQLLESENRKQWRGVTPDRESEQANFINTRDVTVIVLGLVLSGSFQRSALATITETIMGN